MWEADVTLYKWIVGLQKGVGFGSGPKDWVSHSKSACELSCLTKLSRYFSHPDLPLLWWCWVCPYSCGAKTWVLISGGGVARETWHHWETLLLPSIWGGEPFLLSMHLYHIMWHRLLHYSQQWLSLLCWAQSPSNQHTSVFHTVGVLCQ